MGGNVTAGGGERTRIAGSLVVLLGLALAVVQLWRLLGVESLVAVLVETVFPLALALVLVGVGYTVARGALVAEVDAFRFAGWVVSGAGIFLLTDAWIVTLDVFLGYETPGRVVITTNAVTLGAAVGAVLGLYDARNREQTRELRERERRLTRRNGHLDDFVSVVSHDLRNPLNVAMARVELARGECPSDHLDDAARAHDRMEALIEDLLTLARQKEETIETETLGLRAVAEECWRNVDTGDGRLVVETDRTVRGDESQLTRLFENLLRNSIEHGEGDVTVTVGDCEGGFYVADDGPGIPEAEREQVFESGYSTSAEGTGFGLSIVREIVDAHGWEIDATESESGGARFEVTGTAPST